MLIIKKIINIKPTVQGWGLVGVAFIALGLIALLMSFFVSQDDWKYHGVFCVSGALISIFRLNQYRHSNIYVFLVEHRLIFLFAFTFYFLFGASILSFGSVDDIKRTMEIMRVSSSNALFIDALNAIGFGTALIVSVLARPVLLPAIADNLCLKIKNLHELKVIIFLIIVGCVARYYIVSNDFSSHSQTISVLWRILDKSASVGLLLAVLYQGRYQAVLLIFSLLFGFLLSVLGLLGLSKLEFILPILIIIVGLALRTNSRSILVIGFIFSYFGMSVVADPIQFGRMNVESLQIKVSLEERAKLIENGFFAAVDMDILDKYSIWSRISYTTAQAAAVEFYDNGSGDSEYFLIPWIFVPRFLAPNKPLIGTNSGTELNYKVFGTSGSSLGLGPVVEGYYNLGWLGFVFSSVVIGWIISQTSALARTVYRQKALLLYPLMFFGLSMGSQVDSSLTGAWLGPFVITAYFLIVIRLLVFLFDNSRVQGGGSYI